MQEDHVDKIKQPKKKGFWGKVLSFFGFFLPVVSLIATFAKPIMGFFGSRLGMSVLVAGVVAVGSFLFNGVSNDRKRLQQNVDTISAAYDNAQKEKEFYKENYESMVEINKALSDGYIASEKRATAFQRRLRENSDGTPRDFGKVAVEKPRELERAFNKGVEEHNRCFELATGAEVKENEENSICPHLVKPKS